jgi:glycosyltransferase involved in cell wall biosynthesis
MEGFGWYSYEIVKRIVENHPEHEFVFFFDRPYSEKFIFSNNVTPVVISPPARHPLLFIYWFEIGIKRALKKHKIDVFFSPDGYLSLQTHVPQIGVIHDINFKHYPKDLPAFARFYLNYFFPRFAKKAVKLITVSEYSKEDIVLNYQIEPEKIVVAWNGASSVFKPVAEEIKIAVREKYAGGSNYFLFVGAIHPRKNVSRLVEAFVTFKQKSNSSVKLIIVGESLWKNNAFSVELPESLRQEICFTGHLPLEELALLTASALALTYVPYFEGFGIPLVEAMKCGTPILSGNLTSLPEVAGDAALYCDPFDTSDIANKMGEFVSSENLRKELSEKGLERSNLFSWDSAAAIVWEEIALFANPS